MKFESSCVTVTATPDGSARRTSVILFLTASMTSTVFCPDWRRTSMTSVRLPSKKAPVRASSVESSTEATSRSRIGVRPALATTMFANWVDDSSRPSVRSVSSASPCWMKPPGTSTFSATIASRTAPTVRPCALSFSMSSTTWISRARPPDDRDLADAVGRLNRAPDLLVGDLR